MSKVGVVGVITYPSPVGEVTFGGRARSLQMDLGVDHRIFAGLSGFAMLGYGVSKVALNITDSPVITSVSPQIGFGLKYDIPLKGERNDTNTLPVDYSSRPRVFFSYKWKFQPPDPANDLYLGFGADNHQFTMEVGILSWMRLQYGLQFGALQNVSDTLTFGLHGAGLGLKLHLYQHNRWAFFHDIGYFYLRRPYYNLYDSRFLLGNSLEYRFAPGTYLYGGQTVGFMNNYIVHELHLGLTVSPGEIWRKR